MTAYLYPNLPSKAAYRRAVNKGIPVAAKENTPWGARDLLEGTVAFEGPHYPEPHRFYGTATLKDGKVVKVT